MTTVRRISDWLKYGRLREHPALAAFDRDAALQRLRAYEREEWQASGRRLATVWALVILAFIATWLVLEYFNIRNSDVWIVWLLPGAVFQYVMHRRVCRRVGARVAAELRDGRLWTCVGCGYDLRGSEERCPECGTPVRAAAHAAPAAEAT